MSEIELKPRNIPRVEIPHPAIHYDVKIFWPGEGGYGGGTKTFTTYTDALAEVERLKKLGYEKGDGKSEIHIFKRTKSERLR